MSIRKTLLRMVSDAGAAAACGVKRSIAIDSGDLQLLGDLASPGNNKVYGTNGSGTRGWKDDPAGGSGGGMVFNCAARGGGFDVWQRGAGSSAVISVAASTTKYTVDGWYLATGANQAYTLLAAAPIVLGSIKSAYVQRNNGQTGTGTVRFAMPLTPTEVALFAGQYVTLSFTAKAGANWSPASGNLVANLYCGTGASADKRAGSAYTGETNPISLTAALTTSAQRFQATSAAVVSASATQAEIQFSWTPSGTAGADDSFTIDDLQLEVVASSSATASAFERRSFQETLGLCYPHFQKSYDYNTAPGAAVGAGTNGFSFSAATTPNMVAYVSFASPMRQGASLTLTIYDGAGTANKNSYYNGSWNNGGTPGTTQAKEKQFWSNLGGSGTVGFYGMDYTIDAGI